MSRCMFGGMFSGMGCMGSDPFFFDGERSEEDVRREEDRLAEAHKKLEESKRKEITITKDEFMKRAAGVLSSGSFASAMIDRDPKMGFLTMLMVTPLISELTHELFDKEDKEDVRE